VSCSATKKERLPAPSPTGSEQMGSRRQEWCRRTPGYEANLIGIQDAQASHKPSGSLSSHEHSQLPCCARVIAHFTVRHDVRLASPRFLRRESVTGELPSHFRQQWQSLAGGAHEGHRELRESFRPKCFHLPPDLCIGSLFAFRVFWIGIDRRGDCVAIWPGQSVPLSASFFRRARPL
jgi:hypothetical protein